MEYQPVTVKQTDYPEDLPPYSFVKKPLLPLPPSHMRKGHLPQENNFPVYTAPASFVTYPQEYYKKGIAPPPLEMYLPTEPSVNISGNNYSKSFVEGYHEFVRDDCPDKSKVDSSTQVDDHFSQGYNPGYEKGSGYKGRKTDYEPEKDYPPYSRQKNTRHENQVDMNSSGDSQKKRQSDFHSSGYQNDENCKRQMSGSPSNGHDPYIDHRHDDSSRSKNRRDDVSSHQHDNYSDYRKDDYSRQPRNGHVSHRSDDKSKHRRDDHSPRRQNSYSDHQTNSKYGNNRNSLSPNREYKHSEHRSDDNFKYQRNNSSPHRKDIYIDHRSDDKSLHRKNDRSSRRSDTYNDYRRDDKSNHHRNDHSTHHSNGHCGHRDNNCSKHQSNDYSSHRYNVQSDRRNNGSSKHGRKDQSSNRRDNSSDRRSDDSSKRRNGIHTDTSLDIYNDHTEDYRDIYDFSTGDFYTYPIDKEIVSEDDQLYITTDSIGWPLESDSMSSRGSSSAGDLDCKVYVGQIGRGAVKEELEDKFGRYGRIKSVWIARNPPGFAFVVFYNIKDAEHAAEDMDGEIINHRRARVEMSSGKSRWGSAGPPTRRRDSRDGRDSRRQHMYNGEFSRSRSRSPPRYDRYRKYSRSRSRSKSPFENIYRDRR